LISSNTWKWFVVAAVSLSALYFLPPESNPLRGPLVLADTGTSGERVGCWAFAIVLMLGMTSPIRGATFWRKVVAVATGFVWLGTGVEFSIYLAI